MPTVLGVKEGSWSGGRGLQSRDDVTVPRKRFSKTWYVLGDTLNTDEDDVLATTGIPSLYDLVNGAYCLNVSAEETNRVIHPNTGVATGLWEVKADYDSNVDPADGAEDPDDPVQRPPTIRWHGENRLELLERDAIFGWPIWTGAHEPIHVEAPIVSPIVEYKRYELYPFDPNIMISYANKTNSVAFWGAKPGSALMMPMEVDEETIEGIRYAVVTYKIKFNINREGKLEPWRIKMPHVGYNYRPNILSKPIPFITSTGDRIKVKLQESGLKIADSAPMQFLYFYIFTRINFNNLTLTYPV